MKREKIEDSLLAMGIPAKIKGFPCIVDAVEIVEERGRGIAIIKELYPAVAERNDTTPAKAERAIRHAFSVARSEKGNHELTNHYIGFANRDNSSSIMMLHMMLKREEE